MKKLVLKCTMKTQRNPFSINFDCERLYKDVTLNHLYVERSVVFDNVDEPQLIVKNSFYHYTGYAINMKARDVYVKLVRQYDRLLRTDLVRICHHIEDTQLYPNARKEWESKRERCLKEIQALQENSKLLLSKYH